ncbi:MAG: DUF1830 domain-containing protein [Pseudanabaena sp.]|jgi:hypothetical protein
MLNAYLDISNRNTCHYINQTRQIQILRVQTTSNECIERAIFPENDFAFDAPSDAQLEIYTYAIATSVLSDRISCQRLMRK